MERYVALLRGVNVNGHRPLAMRDLREIGGRLGFGRVATVLQSGNLLLSSDLPAAGVRERLEGELARALGGPVPVAVRTAAEWRRALDACPYAGEAPERVFLVFLVDPPEEGARQHLLRRADATFRAGDEFHLGPAEVHLLYRRGMHASRLSTAFLERHLGVAVTARNLRTVRRVDELLAA